MLLLPLVVICVTTAVVLFVACFVAVAEMALYYSILLGSACCIIHCSCWMIRMSAAHMLLSKKKMLNMIYTAFAFFTFLLCLHQTRTYAHTQVASNKQKKRSSQFACVCVCMWDLGEDVRIDDEQASAVWGKSCEHMKICNEREQQHNNNNNNNKNKYKLLSRRYPLKSCIISRDWQSATQQHNASPKPTSNRQDLGLLDDGGQFLSSSHTTSTNEVHEL